MFGREPATPPGPIEPQLTVLVTAHNEAERIQACLHAIRGQDFPMERVEILLVDDRSSDGTAERALALGLPNLRVLRAGDPSPGLTSRQTALDLGFRQARGEIVLVTDAGGRVPRDWLRELTGHMGYRDGAATGPVIFAGRPRFIARFQSLDSLLVYNLYAWAHRRGLACGIIAANMAVRRQAYLEVGGYERIGFAAGPDLVLGQALCREGWSVRFLTAPAVQNLCASGLADLIGRRRRRTRNLAPVIHLCFALMIFSNWALLGMALWQGGLWLTLLIARYLGGVVWIGLSIGKYGPHRLQSIWLYEPLNTLLGSWVYLSLLFAPSWSWGDLTYRRGTASKDDGPAAEAGGS